MKNIKIIFWITTVLQFLFESVMQALTFVSEMGKQGITHLDFPLYFRNTLAVVKVLVVIYLILPQMPQRIKELGNAGFAFDFLFTSISNLIIDALYFQSVFPLTILAVSYFSFPKLHNLTNNAAA